MRKRVLGLVTTLYLLFSVCFNVSVQATAPNGIMNNGLGGIYIDINSAPFTTFQGYSFGGNAYTSAGCAWYASARVNQLTGKGNVIRSAFNWWNNCGSYGFTRSSTPVAGSIICVANGTSSVSDQHVAILEKIEGTTAYISEGGYGSAGSSHGYCVIRKVDVSQIASQYASAAYGGYTNFLGYVCFGVSGGAPPAAPRNCQSGSWDSRVQIQWETVSNATGYECGLIDVNSRNIISKADTTDWYYNFYGVPEGSYYAYVSAYNSAGYSSHSNWARVDVEYSIPPKPTITSNGATIRKNTSAYISWNATDNTGLYMYYLAEYPTGYAYSTNTACGETKETSVEFSNLTSGHYSAFVHSVSPLYKWSAQSNWVDFRVYEEDYVPAKTVTKDNHIYALYDYEMSWTFANELCTDLGGHLVTITSAEENHLITDLIEYGSKDAYWLGATDITDFGKLEYSEKTYRWLTGEAFSYSNWASGEPNSSGENGEKEHFAEIRKSYENKWNDANNINKSNKGFILEIEVDEYLPIKTEVYNGHTYMIFDKNTTWSEAKVFCEQLGGHLATIESSAENEFVKSFIKNGERPWYFIGGQKQNGTWKWLDGNAATDMTLSNNAAYFAGTNLMMYRSAGTCVGLDNTYYPASEMGNLGFICEMDIVVPILTPIETIAEDITAEYIVENGTIILTVSSDTIALEDIQMFVCSYENNAIRSVTEGTKEISSNKVEITAASPDSAYTILVWDKNLTPLINAVHVDQ